MSGPQLSPMPLAGTPRPLCWQAAGRHSRRGWWQVDPDSKPQLIALQLELDCMLVVSFPHHSSAHGQRQDDAGWRDGWWSQQPVPADLQDLQVLQLAPGAGQRPREQRVAHTQRLQTLHGAPGSGQGSRHLGAPQVQGCQGAHACPALWEGALQAGGGRASPHLCTCKMRRSLQAALWQPGQWAGMCRALASRTCLQHVQIAAWKGTLQDDKDRASASLACLHHAHIAVLAGLEAGRAPAHCVRG